MYDVDLELLRCPATGEPLQVLAATTRAADGELLEGCVGTATTSFPVRNGIPRFVEDVSYNASWDYKWRVLDGGRGLNYRILDKTDPAYAIHDIYDRNGHDGAAFEHMRGGIVLDLGCGVGQYAVKTLLEHEPAKVVAVDLTGGVDIFRRVVEERYPQLKARLLIVQANVFALPFAAESFDYVYSLGVLMHTGETLRALGIACGLVRPGGELNVWLYCSEPVAYDAVEKGRESALSLANFKQFQSRQWYPMFWIHLFRRIDHRWAVALLKLMSSNRYYAWSKTPQRYTWFWRLFPNVDHPDPEYRLINNYDGYVNNWCDTWSEHEVFPVLREHSIALLGMSSWRLGLWGRKIPGFYPESVNKT